MFVKALKWNADESILRNFKNIILQDATFPLDLGHFNSLKLLQFAKTRCAISEGHHQKSY